MYGGSTVLVGYGLTHGLTSVVGVRQCTAGCTEVYGGLAGTYGGVYGGCTDGVQQVDSPRLHLGLYTVLYIRYRKVTYPD